MQKPIVIHALRITISYSEMFWTGDITKSVIHNSQDAIVRSHAGFHLMRNGVWNIGVAAICLTASGR